MYYIIGISNVNYKRENIGNIKYRLVLNKSSRRGGFFYESFLP